MLSLMQKIPFILELIVNGGFIVLMALHNNDKLPESWSPELIQRALSIGAWFVPLVLFFVIVVNYLNVRNIEEFFRRHVFSLIIFVPLVLTWGDLDFAYWLSAVHLLSSILFLYDEKEDSGDASEFIKREGGSFLTKLKPAQIVFLSFAGVIMIGTFLLMIPFATVSGESLSFVDALFMATSATCVTGLATVPLSSLSLFGQIVLLILIQVGGLSIMTLYSSMAILLGRSIGMKDRVLLQDLLDVSSLDELFAMIVNIMKYTFLIETWGGIILTIGFSIEGYSYGDALYYGFYHSISAFCNAGLSLFDNSLESYATNPLISGTVAVLITLGGIGFIVLKEVTEIVRRKRTVARMTLHTKTVLVFSFGLTVGAFLLIFFGEFMHSLTDYTLWEKVQIAFFQSVTLRTAGFNTVPLTLMQPYTLYMMTIVMFIGASPGSTGGGLKTTTLAILLQSVISTLRGRNKVTLFQRKIAPQVVVRATALTIISIVIASIFIFILMKVQPNEKFLPLSFEVISALGTVGLSLGTTASLTFAGKVAISVVMFIGRIGPLTMLLALAERNVNAGRFDYPDGRMLIG